MTGLADSVAPKEERRDPVRNKENRKRYFDPKYGKTIVKILPGQCYVTNDDEEMIVTVLGSCVSACVRDVRSGLGGMNHFMLPEGDSSDWKGAGAVLRYGSDAMETLFNSLLRHGVRREHLEVKVFGGANVIGRDVTTGIGSKNASFVTRYLKNEGYPVAASDLGGVYGRRIHFVPKTGKVARLLLRRAADKQIFETEKSLRSKLSVPKDGGDIELFD